MPQLFKYIKHRWKPASILLGVVVGGFLFYQIFYNLMTTGKVLPYCSIQEFAWCVGHNFVIMLLGFIINCIIIFKINRIPNIVYKIIADVLTSCFISGLLVWALVFFTRPYRFDWAGTMFCNTFLLLGIEGAYYVRHYRLSLLQAEGYRHQMLMYQYRILKAQVNPHFLFNSLNILYSLNTIDREKSQKFILSLSEMYRYVVSRQEHERVLLADELKFINSYVDVLKMRYYNQFDVEVIGTENIGAQEIIPFTMQLLIENVTKHNIISSKFPMKVQVAIGPEAIVVTNPIHAKAIDNSTGIGLRYITNLYQINGCSFSYSLEGGIFKAVIPYLPPPAIKNLDS